VTHCSCLPAPDNQYRNALQIQSTTKYTKQSTQTKG
jgi:hypothetical protein